MASASLRAGVPLRHWAMSAKAADDKPDICCVSASAESGEVIWYCSLTAPQGTALRSSSRAIKSASQSIEIELDSAAHSSFG